MIYSISQLLFWLFFYTFGKIFFDFRIKGVDNLKKLEPDSAIFAANHIGYFDTAIIGPTIRTYHGRCIRFVTYYKYITRKFYGFFVWFFGGFPVYPGRGDIKASTRSTIKILDRGHDVLIFPIGMIKADIDPSIAKQGLGYIARETGRQVVPVTINGMYKLSLVDFLFRRKRIDIIYGAPVYYDELCDADDEPVKFSIKIMARIKRTRDHLIHDLERGVIGEEASDHEFVFPV